MEDEFNSNAKIKKVSWKEIRAEVIAVNLDLANIIDQISPESKYALYKASYPFGYESVKKGQLYLPNDEGDPVFLSDSSNELKNNLSYNLGSNPASLVLSNSFEICITLKNHTIPFVLAPQGSILSTWLVLDPGYNHQPAFLWDISAGARSIFMLPKISIADKYNKLKQEFDLKADLPKSLLEHGNIFRELANRSSDGKKWSADVLYFGKQWFDHLEDETWASFYNYLYRKAWRSSGFWRSEFIWNLIFSLIQNSKNLKPNPYIADTVKHLLAMGVGAYPGFAPVIDEIATPINCLQDAIMNVYQLNNQMPIIMQPHYFSVERPKNRPVYYSLNYPTTFNFSPKSRKNLNKIIELGDVQYLLKKYLNEIASDTLNLHDTPLEAIATKAKYDFFHSESRLNNGIRSTFEIVKEDNSFKKISVPCQNKEFPVNSSFLRGCVRISDRKDV